MKRKFSVIFILLAFIITIGCFSGFRYNGDAFAQEKKPGCKSTYLMDAMTGTVIMKENETERLPIASMCKIMTLLLSFEAFDDGVFSFEDKIPVSDAAAGMGGSQVFLESGAEYKAEDLIKSIAVASANDACVAMAEFLCGDEQSFVDKMNERAVSLGMENTVFVNCTGLPKAGQYSCAKDVASMFSELLKHKEYFVFSRIWMDEISHPKDRKTEISNTNKLIRFYEGCDSGKTGYTSEAGHCLAASAMRRGMRLISVVISAPDSKTRFNTVTSMFNYGFANYEYKTVIDDKRPLDIAVEVAGGKKNTLEAVAEKPFFLFNCKGVKRSVEIDFEPIGKVKAPVTKGDRIGTLHVYENGVEIAAINVLSNEDIASKTYFDSILDIGKNWALT